MTQTNFVALNILVTGADGFIGRAVVAELCRRGHKILAMVRDGKKPDPFAGKDAVTRIVADVTEPASLMAAMSGVDAVIHLAGIVWGDTMRMQDVMVDGTRNVIEAMHKTNVPRLILASSFAVYNWSKVTGRLTESSPLAESSTCQQGTYSMTKTEQELLSRSLCEKFNINLTVLRPAGVVAFDNFDAADLGPRMGPVQFVIAPRRQLRIVSVNHVADALASACSANLPNGLTVNLVDEDFITAWELACRLRRRNQYSLLIFPLPYVFFKGIAHLVYPLAKLSGLEQCLPGLFSPGRLASRFKAVSCDSSLWLKYLPLNSAQSLMELFPDSHSSENTKNL